MKYAMNSSRSLGSHRRGMVIPLTLFAAMAMVYFIFTLSTMNRGYRSQLQHLNQQQAMFNVACAGYSRVLARLYEKPWDERFFKTGPSNENNLSYEGAKYDCYVADVPGKSQQLDIYIRVRLAAASQCYFWRIIYNDDLLDITGRSYPIVFTDLPATSYPGTGGGSSFGPVIDSILKDRKNNKAKAEEKSQLSSPLTSVNDIARVFPARKPGDPLIPEPKTGTQHGSNPSQEPAVFTDDKERNQVSPADPAYDPTKVDLQDGPINLVGNGRATRVAQTGGTVVIEPYLWALDIPTLAVILVHLFDENGQEIRFSGKPLMVWKRKDLGYLPCYFQGVEKAESIVPGKAGVGANNYDPVSGLRYTFNMRKGQKVVVELSGSGPPGFLKLSSPAFE